MKNIILILTAMIALTASAIYIKGSRFSETTSLDEKRIQVVASFYPLAFFAEQVGGDKVIVTNITPSGAEPHDYEPTTADLTKIAASKLLISIGPIFESWQRKVVANNVLQVASALPTNTIQNNDPHIWLDPVLARETVSLISKSLTEFDPSNREYYAKNEQKLLQEVDALDHEFKTQLRNCTKHDIVTSHAAFGYLADQYGFNQISIAGLSPDEEPTPQKLTEITKLVRQKNIQYIFFESLVSPRLSETIANETHAKTLVFNPLEGLTPEETQNGENYFSIQRNNLKNLRTALSCM